MISIPRRDLERIYSVVNIMLSVEKKSRWHWVLEEINMRLEEILFNSKNEGDIL